MENDGPQTITRHGEEVAVVIDIAREWGAQSKTQPITAVDALIAATAKSRGWTVVTRDVKDFDTTGVRLLNPFTD